MTIKTGVIVFATDDSREGVADARAWLKASGLTPADVRLYQHDGQTLVQTLRPGVKILRAPAKDC